MAKCLLCGKEINDLKFENHLSEYHDLNYQEYYEVIKFIPEPEECWKCRSINFPLTYLHPEFLSTPCWTCLKKKTQQETAKKQILDAIKEYQSEVLGNKFYRHILSSRKTFSSSLCHTLPETAGILDQISKNSSVVISRRTEYFSISPKIEAIPLEISQRNLFDLVLNIHPFSCNPSDDGSFEIILGRRVYHLQLPEIVPYEPKHHQKYSLLSKSRGVRSNGRRLLIGKTEKVYRFYDNPDNPNHKSIFKFQEPVNPLDIDALNYIILTDKTFSGIVTEIYNEICPSLSGVFDKVFMRNYIKLAEEDETGLRMEFSWNKKETNDEIITISIWT